MTESSPSEEKTCCLQNRKDDGKIQGDSHLWQGWGLLFCEPVRGSRKGVLRPLGSAHWCAAERRTGSHTLAVPTCRLSTHNRSAHLRSSPTGAGRCTMAPPFHKARRPRPCSLGATTRGACPPSPDSITGPHTHQACVCCDLRDPAKGSDSRGNACPRHPLGEHLPRARRRGRDRGPAGSVVGRPSLPLAFRQQGGQTHNKTHVHTLPQILGSTGQKTTQGEAGVPGGRFYAEEQTPPPPGRGHST